jgi:hypothetical protein
MSSIPFGTNPRPLNCYFFFLRCRITSKSWCNKYPRLYYYYWVDTSTDGLLVPECITSPVVTASALPWYITFTFAKLIETAIHRGTNGFTQTHHDFEVILHYMIKSISDLRMLVVFFGYSSEILLKVALNTINQTKPNLINSDIYRNDVIIFYDKLS